MFYLLYLALHLESPELGIFDIGDCIATFSRLFVRTVSLILLACVQPLPLEVSLFNSFQ